MANALRQQDLTVVSMILFVNVAIQADLDFLEVRALSNSQSPKEPQFGGDAANMRFWGSGVQVNIAQYSEDCCNRRRNLSSSSEL